MSKQSKAITTRLNKLAGVSEPEGRNGFRRLAITENGNRIDINEQERELLLNMDAIYLCDECEAGTYHVNDVMSFEEIDDFLSMCETTKSKDMKYIAIAISGKYWVQLCKPTDKETAAKFEGRNAAANRLP